MKNIRNLVKLLLLLAFGVVAMPVFASCPISGGACTAFSNYNSKSLQEKYAPNYLQEIQKPNAFQPNYITPYYDELINTESSNATANPPTSDYNSNCQFGVCLPGVEGGGSVLE